MNDEYAELLEAVLVNREGDPPRLAMADWFERNDRPAAADRIRQQLVDRREFPHDAVMHYPWGDIERFKPDWANPIVMLPPPFNVYWSRGFISRVVCNFDLWRSIGPKACWEWRPSGIGLRLSSKLVDYFDPHPIETVVLTDGIPSRRWYDFDRVTNDKGEIDWDGGFVCRVWPTIRFFEYSFYTYGKSRYANE